MVHRSLKRFVCAAPLALAASVLMRSAAHAADAAAAPTPEGIAPEQLAKAIVGLVVLLVLAYVAGHPRVHRLERTLRLSSVVATGLPFVVLGLVAHLPSVGVLPDPVLHGIAPVLPLGLGWIGFVNGFRFETRSLDGAERVATRAAAMAAVGSFAAIAAATAGVLLGASGFAGASSTRDALLLGAAGMITATSLPPETDASGPSASAQIDELMAMCALVLIAAFFRPPADAGGWRLPALAWVFVTLGMGTAFGALAAIALGAFRKPAEVTLVMLGTIAFCAGMASYLRVSPIVVCFLAGALVSNLPGQWKAQVRETLFRLERPLYLCFLVIAGAMWRVGDWQGWALMVLFVVARLVGRRAGLRLAHPRMPRSQRDERAAAPVGALAVAIAVNARDLYPNASIAWIVTAVIGGAVVTEIIAQAQARRSTRAPVAPAVDVSR